jgi:hypothetical protein
MLRTSVSVILIILGLILPLAACGEPGGGMTGSSPLWPSDVDGWKIAEGPTDYDRITVFKYMDGAAELFQAYNMRKLTVVRYEKPGRPAITLEIFLMGSPEDAYGLFSFEADDPGAGIGQGSEFGGGLLRFWKGYHFVSAYGENQGADIEAATLLSFLTMIHRLGQYLICINKVLPYTSLFLQIFHLISLLALHLQINL